MNIPTTMEVRFQLRDLIESQEPDYAVTSFDVVNIIEQDMMTYYILRDIKLIGIPKPSADGKTDGQALPKILAPSWMPIMPGCIFAILKPSAYQGENI